MLGFAILFLCWQTCRGIAEGITMFQPGPRMHPLFDWYHAVRVAEIVSLCGACWFLFDGCLMNWLFFAGLSVLAWECFELSYLWARLGQAAAHENILGLWAFNGPVWWLHAARLMIGAALMIGGIK